MSHFKDHDTEYQSRKAFDPNYENPQWCAIENHEERIKKLEELLKAKPLVTTKPPKNEEKDDDELPEPGKWIKTIQVTLENDPVQRDRDTANGTVPVANFNGYTKYGSLRFSLWGDRSDKIMDYTEGATVSISNLQVREPYKGDPQVSDSRNTRIKKVE